MEVNRQKMDLKQSFMILAMVGALSTSIITTTVMAQNMTGGNITGGNMTGKISGGLFTYDEDYSAKYGQQMARCTPPEVEVSEGKCGIDQSRQGDGSADSAAATAADDDDGGDTNSGDGGGQDQSEDDEEQEGGN